MDMFSGFSKKNRNKLMWYVALSLVIGILIGFTVATGAEYLGLAKGGVKGPPAGGGGGKGGAASECNDHIDNDGDGFCDFPSKRAYCSDGSELGDRGCYSKKDNDESGCGDGVCEGNEACNVCVADCGWCVACGDGICDAGETCNDCPEDCGACLVCGDGVCNGAETCTDCPKDCGECVVCGDGVCNGNESCSTCEADCGTCEFCGNGICAPTEDCASCSSDCGTCEFCGDGSCNGVENCTSCGIDCGVCNFCGDSSCNYNETCADCEVDCGTCEFCGDSICGSDENCQTCAQDCGDCGTCGDGTCDTGESCYNCDIDCGVCDSCSARIDAGLDPGKWGYVEGSLAGVEFRYDDYCDGNTVVEYYCFLDKSKSIRYDCGPDYSCVNGMCTDPATGSDGCTDSDDGIDSSTGGNITITGDGIFVDYFDQCWTIDKVREKYCDFDGPTLLGNEIVLCPEGDYCLLNRCVSSINENIVDCSDTDNDQFTAGSISGVFQGNQYQHSDYCTDFSSVLEYGCVSQLLSGAYIGMPKFSEIMCTGQKCEGGRCIDPFPEIECTSTGTGRIDVKDTITVEHLGETMILEEYCEDDDILVTYGCNTYTDIPYSNRYRCSHDSFPEWKCIDGACYQPM